MERNDPKTILQSNEWTVYNAIHFNLYYRPDSRASKRIDSVVTIQEKGFIEIHKKLHQPIISDKINFFIFNSLEDKINITNHRSDAHAISSYNSVYYVDNPELSNVFGLHEVSHIIVHKTIGLGAAGPFKLFTNEGLAVWTEDKWGKLPLYDYYKKKFNENDICEPIEFIDKYDKTDSLKNVYGAWGAFTKYLIDNYGIDKFIILHKTGNDKNGFKNIYGISVEEANEQFLVFIKNRIDPATRME